MITIPLDEQLSPLENAQKYFERYNKLKRTHEALTTLIEETKSESKAVRCTLFLPTDSICM